MKNEEIVGVNEYQPLDVRRWSILDDGTIKDFDKEGNIVDKQHYAISTSRGGGSSVVIGELTKDEIIELGVLIDRFINNLY